MKGIYHILYTIYTTHTKVKKWNAIEKDRTQLGCGGDWEVGYLGLLGRNGYTADVSTIGIMSWEIIIVNKKSCQKIGLKM